MEPLALDANFQCAFLCLEEPDANFRADLMDSLLTGSLSPPVVVVLNMWSLMVSA